jgi:8-amino-7-oxononanoate synthase
LQPRVLLSCKVARVQTPTLLIRRHGIRSMPKPIAESPAGPIVRIDGREYLYFVGTGYLGLQSHAEVISAACDAAQRYGLHSATSRAGFGNTPPTLLLERRAAEFFGCEASFYFSAGYASNSILMRTVESNFDAVFLDEHSHYSVLDAAAQSGRPTFRFRHRDAADLADKLREHLQPGERPLAMTDGVFSVRGTIAPLADYCEALDDYAGSGLMVDDAHGVGVLGDRGRGTLEHFGLCDDDVNGEVTAAGDKLSHPLGSDVSPLDSGLVKLSHRARSGETPLPRLLLCATLSKALGGFGGIIPGSERFIEGVRKASHWFDGATAPPAPVTAASARALELIQANPELRTRLWSNVRLLKKGLRAMGFEVDDTPVPIVCLVAGNAENMQRIQRELMRRGIAVAYMAAYSGLSAAGGLRIAVFAAHTEAMIGQFLDELRQIA